ncbi:MAG: hypothetical protein HYY13_07365 [Nitrospirae bacterium]|nr:hypothetical protein [Nitrospirota bacterium]
MVSTTAFFTQAFVKVGLLPDGGSTFFLPRLVGLTRALEMMLTAEKIDAARAEAIGMVSVVPDDRLESEVSGLARPLAAAAPLALAATKRTVYENLSAELPQALDLEK